LGIRAVSQRQARHDACGCSGSGKKGDGTCVVTMPMASVWMGEGKV
jgi:hypothetical protein